MSFRVSKATNSHDAFYVVQRIHEDQLWVDVMVRGTSLYCHTVRQFALELVAKVNTLQAQKIYLSVINYFRVN